MKSTVLALIWLLAVGRPAFASDCVTTAAAPRDNDAIRKLTREWAEAYVARDRGWFERNYADEVAINGKLRIREQEIRSLDAVKSFDIPDADFRVAFYGNAAVTTGTETIVASTAEGEKSYRGRFTSVFVWCSGRWLVALDDYFPLK